jgi:PKD repeat protein
MRSDSRRLVGLSGALSILFLALLGSCTEVTNPASFIPFVDSLSVTAPNPRVVRVAWGTPTARDGVAENAGYVVERRQNFSGPFERVGITRDPNARAFVDTRISPEMWYGYRVRVLSLREELGPPSPIQGLRTLPPPGIVTSVVNEGAGSAGAPDPDGYIIRVVGGDLDTSMAVGGRGINDSVRLAPLPLGSYTVRLSGIAPSCDRLSDTVQQVIVTDTGRVPLSQATFRTRCFDPTSGRVVVVITASGTALDNSYRVSLDGERAGVNLPDSLRLIARDVPVSLSQNRGETSFNGLPTGTFRVRLQDVEANCTLADTTTRVITTRPASRDTVRFAVTCRSSQPGSALPIKIRSTFGATTAPPGSAVALDVSIDTRDSSTTLNVSGYTIRVGYDSTLLRVDSIVSLNTAYGTFSPNPTFATGQLSVIGLTSGAGPTGLIPAFRVHMRVSPTAAVGASLGTQTTVSNLLTFRNGTGNAIQLNRVGVAEDGTLTVGTAVANQVPVAEANGPYTGTAATALAFSSAGTRDPDGSIATYAWTFGDGNTSAQPNPSHTYAAAGTFTARLTVTDNRGATAADSATVTIAAAGGGTGGGGTGGGGTGGGGSGGTLADSGGVGGLPIGLRLRFPTASADSGSLVTAQLYYDARDSAAALAVMGGTVRIRYDRTRLRFEAARAGESRFGTFSVNSEWAFAENDTGLSIIALAGGTAGAPRGRLANIDFTVIGRRGTAAAAAPAVVVNLPRIQPPDATTIAIAVSRIGLSGDTLLINGGTGGGTGGGGTGGGGTGGGGTPTNQSPVAEANGPYTGTAGSPIAFSSAGSRDPDGTIASFAWAFGDGGTSTEANPSRTFTSAGTYTARLTVTDNQGAVSRDSATVTVTAQTGGTTPFTWTNAFGAVAAGIVPMTATLDLRPDILETPSSEVLLRFAVDSIVFDPAVISCEAGCVNFPAGVSRTNVDLTRAAAGVIRVEGQLASPVNAGQPVIMTLRFTVRGAAGRSVTTRTFIRSMLGDASTGSYEYAGRFRVVEGTFTVP